jgi:hypothetical protein
MQPGASGLITDLQLVTGTSLDAVRLARKLAPPLPVSVATGNGHTVANA